MTIITPTSITGINSISSSGNTLAFQNVSGGNINVSGLNISSGANINISGVSTFTTGPVLIGAGSSTGTASQPLQVTGGAYISGNLGLGIVNPTYKLDIEGGGNITTQLSLWGKTIGQPQTLVEPGRIYATAAGLGPGDLLLQPTGGNIGIGTISASVKLHVHATGDDLAVIRLSGSAILQTPFNIRQGIVGVSNSGFSIYDVAAAATRFAIDSAGNIGVGTANPTSKLHVVDGNITAGDVTLGQTHIDIMKMWRTADIQGYKSDYGDGGAVSYTWDNGTVRIDSSVGSHNWDVGKVRLPAGVYQIYLQYRPSPTQHGWNVYGTNSNAHRIRLQSDAGYGSYTEFLVVIAQLNKDVGYSRLFTSGTYQVTTETTYRIGMQTDPYTTGGYKCFIESAYLIKLR